MNEYFARINQAALNSWLYVWLPFGIAQGKKHDPQRSRLFAHVRRGGER